jgi:Flp pilus assembly protein TadD
MAREFDAAIDCARSAVQTVPNNVRAYHRLACALAYRGDVDKARDALGEANRIMPNPPRAYFAAAYPFADPQDLEFFLDGLRKAGWEG